MRVIVDAFAPAAEHGARAQAEPRRGRHRDLGEPDLRPVFPLPLLSRRPPCRGRHGRHDGARLRHDGGRHATSTRVVEYRFRGPDTAITGRGEGALIATALTDVLSDGLSMVYSFFDPTYSDRSLGTFMILDHIVRARKMGLPYVYLGYWVDGSRKMGYKRRFRPDAEPRGVHRPDLSAGRHRHRPTGLRLRRAPPPLPADGRLRPRRPVRGTRALRNEPPPRAGPRHLVEACLRRLPLALLRRDRRARRLLLIIFFVWIAVANAHLCRRLRLRAGGVDARLPPRGLHHARRLDPDRRRQPSSVSSSPCSSW